jgi:hypothetical protein
LREGWRLVKDDYWLFLGITFVGVLLGGMAPLGILMGPAMCGIHYCLFRCERGRRVSFDMLFRGFDYFAPSLVATLIMVVPMILLGLVSYLLFVAGSIGAFVAMMPKEAPGQPPDAAAFGVFMGLMALYFLAIIAISLVFHLFFFFTYPLIVDRGLSGFEAVKLSIKAAFGNFFGVFGVIFLSQLLSMVGVLACYIGVIFVVPVTFAMVSVAYQQVFQDEDSLDEVDEIYDPAAPALPRAGPDETGIQGADS